MCALLTKLMLQQLSIGNGNVKPPDSIVVQRMLLFAKCGSVLTVQCGKSERAGKPNNVVVI